MVVALLALSLVMILGGIAAVVQGFPYVRLESGLAMVIGGSTAASAGVILLGLTALLDRLRKLPGDLAYLRDGAVPSAPRADLPPEAASWDASTPVASLFPVPEVTPPERPSLAGLGAAGLAGLSVGALRPGARGSEPMFEDAPPRDEPREDPAEPLLPDLLPEPAPPHGTGTEETDPFAAPEPPAPALFEPTPVPSTTPLAEAPVTEAPVPEATGLRPSLDAPQPAEATAAEPVADAPEATEAEAASEAERHAVGSYASGANTYVMFSDGSIEADTPRGRFTFASLDELKSFVNAGGEEARGAA